MSNYLTKEEIWLVGVGFMGHAYAEVLTYEKGKIKTILEYHWHGFLKIYENKIRPNVKKVEKVLKCKYTKYGFVKLKCSNCNTTKKIGFTCKSRFCTSCGKIYIDN